MRSKTLEFGFRFVMSGTSIIIRATSAHTQNVPKYFSLGKNSVRTILSTLQLKIISRIILKYSHSSVYELAFGQISFPYLESGFPPAIASSALYSTVLPKLAYLSQYGMKNTPTRRVECKKYHHRVLIDPSNKRKEGGKTRNKCLYYS